MINCLVRLMGGRKEGGFFLGEKNIGLEHDDDFTMTVNDIGFVEMTISLCAFFSSESYPICKVLLVS